MKPTPDEDSTPLIVEEPVGRIPCRASGARTPLGKASGMSAMEARERGQLAQLADELIFVLEDLNPNRNAEGQVEFTLAHRAVPETPGRNG